MRITRIVNGKKHIFTLTHEEISEAHEEYIVSFMTTVLQNEFGLKDEDAEKVAKKAYDFYAEGTGLTEYESIEKAYDRWNSK